MFIKPEYRGRGLMSLLNDAVRRQANQENVLEIRLYVHRNNARATRAYRREGFSESPYQIMVMKPWFQW
jgi:ribosomal protein S18 acetylase RimI-like enzyme